MTTSSKPAKAKRRLENFSFEEKGAHVALVGPAVGGAANGYVTLVTKSTKNLSEDFIQKAQQIKVTLELPEFLRTFFGMWYEDAEVLARLLGYVPDIEEKEAEEKSYAMQYEDFIQSKLEAFEVLKSLSTSESISDCLAGLSEDQMLAVMRDQQMFEKALNKAEEEPAASAVEGSNETPVEETGSVNKSVEVGVQTKPTVIKKEETQVTIENVEMVAQAELELVQKALSDQKIELQKALDLVKKYEDEKAAAIAKSRMDAITAAVGAEKAVVLFKALGGVDTAEVFDEVLEVVKALAATAGQTELFEESGATTEVEEPAVRKSKTLDILKAKYAVTQAEA